MKDEKQVQNEITEPKATNGIDVAQIMSMLGFTPQSETEVSIDERSEFIVIPDLFLECKTTVKNNKTYKDYILHGKLRGVSAEVYFRPGKNRSGYTDVNSYKLLDIVFGTGSSSLFAVRVINRTDTRTQRRTKTMEYVAYAKDKDTNFEYYAPLVLDTISDRAVLTQLLACSNATYNLNLPL